MKKLLMVSIMFAGQLSCAMNEINRTKIPMNAQEDSQAFNSSSILMASSSSESGSDDRGFQNIPTEKESYGWIKKYIPINFAYSSDDNISFKNNPVPSKVGFYDGDNDAYMNLILEKYPDGSCIQEQQHTHKKIDVTERERFEQIVQDALTQGRISQELSTAESFLDLESKKNAAVQSRDFWNPWALFGIRSMPAPTISPELLRKETSATRAKIYLGLKQESNLIDLRDSNNPARNEFEEKLTVFKQNPTAPEGTTLTERTIPFIYAAGELENNYCGLKKKVELGLQINAANREKRMYQAGFAIGVATAAAGFGYWYTRKK